ncbi:50S ribosomal protein L11 methyltransferase [Tabrizicola sp.]|uniref:50S ribosomal protein L11 methyltransferase n=1 Tax=Tabrizicola sp. TaxID=2005166 RepID=UPI00286A1AB5|nr:50S ribosomal protein L11 methyltransferase [Tabrizicola sp.]
MENNAQARLYDHVNQLLAGHEKLLSDGNRNRLFYQALKNSITSESCVLDIGSGTGVWAIAAACLGARRVVAVEQDQLLIGLIKALAQANGVANRVEVVQGDALQVELSREFDIVISETIGHLVFDEQIVPIMIAARERFLKPDGVLIPQTVSLVAAPAHFESQRKLPADIPVEYGYFESLLLNHPVGLTDRTKLKIMREPQELIRSDLTGIKSSPDLNNLAARWEVQETNQINCFAVWAEMTLTPGVRLETLNTSSWSPMIYRISRFKQEQGTLEFKLTLTSICNYWTAILTNDQSREAQSYSPASAATVLLARMRTDLDLLNHSQRIGVTL